MEESLKTLSVSTSDNHGGAAKAAYRIHVGINQIGGDSCMFVKDKQSVDEKVIPLSKFVPLLKINKPIEFIIRKIQNKIQHYKWNQYPRREQVFFSDLRSVSIHGALQKIDYDVLHLHWINLRFLNLKELIKVKKPIIWTLHDSWTFTGICHYFYSCERYKVVCGNCPFLHSNKEDDLSKDIWKKKNRIYKKLDLNIVTPSKWLADLVTESSLLERFPVTVIPNPLDEKVYSQGNKSLARNRIGLNHSDKVILFGAVNPTEDKNKGFQELIKAIGYLEDSNNSENLVLVIFGAKYSIDLKTTIPIYNLGYLESDEEIVNAYRAANVMVVPSLSEVFGQTASEAMACGTPVVAFNCTGIKEVVDHKQNGYLAKPYDPEDLAKGIEWCLKNNEDSHLSLNARKKVEENYAMEIVAKKYMDLYQSL